MQDTRTHAPRAQNPRTSDDPRIPALADRMDDLVSEIRRQRAEDGSITEETAQSFRDTEAAYWLVIEDADGIIPAIQQEQVTAALAAYSGPRAATSSLRQIAPSSYRHSPAPLPA